MDIFWTCVIRSLLRWMCCWMDNLTMKHISTAPKDGTTILLVSKSKKRFASGEWIKGVWVWPYVNMEPAYWARLPEVKGEESF